MSKKLSKYNFNQRPHKFYRAIVEVPRGKTSNPEQGSRIEGGLDRSHTPARLTAHLSFKLLLNSRQLNRPEFNRWKSGWKVGMGHSCFYRQFLSQFKW